MIMYLLAFRQFPGGSGIVRATTANAQSHVERALGARLHFLIEKRGAGSGKPQGQQSKAPFRVDRLCSKVPSTLIDIHAAVLVVD
jgi:hypothetical protein